VPEILPMFGHRDPTTITPSDVQEWIGGLKLKSGSIRAYLATLREVVSARSTRLASYAVA
jgi:hypothetical protein